MKKRMIILCAILAMVVSVFADAVILEFRGAPSENRIVLNWKTGDEDNIDLFMIERSSNDKDFSKIGEVPSKGDQSEYEYIDSNLTSVKNIYYYRLKIRRTNGTFQISESISVIPKISSFAKTWGSIKALFQ
jgi:hypothetical protein